MVSVRVLEKSHKRTPSMSTISKNVYYSSMLGLHIPHKGKMVKTPRGAYRLLLSTAKGAGVLGQLGRFEYDWLKQVPVIFVCSNWPGLARDWSGL